MNYLKRILGIMGGIVGLALSVGLTVYFYSIVKDFIFLGLGFIAVCVFFPILIRHGVKTVFKERDAVYTQLSHHMKVKYNIGRTFRGFVEILLTLWLVVPPIMLIPGNLAVLVLPVVSIAIFVVEGLTAGVWSDIGWSKGLYWLMNIGIYIVGIVLGAVLNALIYN